MRPLVFTLLILLLPGLGMAAEALSNNKLENTYIPEASCLPDKDKKHRKSCTGSPGSRTVTDKALRDAEQQRTRQLLGNPQLNNADILPPPTELPPPTIQQQNLLRRLETMQHPPEPVPAP